MSENARMDLFGTGTASASPAPPEEPVVSDAAPAQEPEAACDTEMPAQPINEEATAQECEAPASAAETEEAPEEAQAEPTPCEEQPQDDKWDAVIEAQQQMLERLGEMNELFSKRILHTEHEEKVIDRMHAELQKYKEDLYAQLVRPILLEVIEVRESILRMAETYRAKPEGEQSIPNKTFSDYAEFDLQDILENNGVTIYRGESGEEYVPVRQRIIKKVPTTDEALHGKIAQSMSCGYEFNGRVVSAEKVAVYLYEKPVEETEKTENSEVEDNG